MMSKTPLRHHPLTVILVPVLIFLAACVSTEVPQGWWNERGPVIPHDSFPADCSMCHAGDGWNEIRDDFEFDHEAETGIALTGAHQDAQCLRCHNDRGPVATFASRGCAGCHEDVHLGKLGSTCQDCHGERNWAPQGQIADHARYGFALVGAHAATSCDRCHEGFEAGIFSPTDSSCESCHAAPAGAVGGGFDHILQGLTDSCERCHLPTTFKTAGFHHDRFPLTGSHTSLDCASCHDSGVFEGLGSRCFDCHSSEFFATTDPDHAAETFPHSCQDCHNTTTWEGALFNHAGITTGCVNCHLPEYQTTTDPDHLARNFPTSCQTCHSTNTWQGANFNHSGVSDGCVDCHMDQYLGTIDPDHAALAFPTSCQDCHGTNTWDGASFVHLGITNGCIACHQPDYDGASDPDHVAFSFPTSCEECHTTKTWDGASFDHPGITTSCVTCHMADYDGARGPNHANQGFPTTCEDCHNGTNTWNNVTFTHDFPIDSGAHKKFDCTDCHVSGFSSFSCTVCHGQFETRKEHDPEDVPGYVWSSPACYSCHPNGDH